MSFVYVSCVSFVLLSSFVVQSSDVGFRTRHCTAARTGRVHRGVGRSEESDESDKWYSREQKKNRRIEKAEEQEKRVESKQISARQRETEGCTAAWQRKWQWQMETEMGMKMKQREPNGKRDSGHRQWKQNGQAMAAMERHARWSKRRTASCKKRWQKEKAKRKGRQTKSDEIRNHIRKKGNHRKGSHRQKRQ